MSFFVCCGFISAPVSSSCCDLIFIVVSDDDSVDAPICLFTLSSYETVFGLYQCFFFPSARGGRSQGAGHEDKPRPHSICHRSRKDTQIALLLFLLLLLLLLLLL